MQDVTRRTFAGGIALLSTLRFSAARAQAGVTPAEARAIAKEAYVYGFPLVDSYRIQYDYFVDSKGPEFKARLEFIANTPRVAANRTRPNPDAQLGHTPYSCSWASTCAPEAHRPHRYPRSRRSVTTMLNSPTTYTFIVDYALKP